MALIARSLKNGFSGAWPLALGAAIGDVVWPVLALLTSGQSVDCIAKPAPPPQHRQWRGATYFTWSYFDHVALAQTRATRRWFLLVLFLIFVGVHAKR